MTADARNEVIVEAVINLAHALGLNVIAEESKATCDRLVALGCYQAQGYYLGMPMPAGDLDAWLRKDAVERVSLPAQAVWKSAGYPTA